MRIERFKEKFHQCIGSCYIIHPKNLSTEKEHCKDSAIHDILLINLEINVISFGI